MLRSLTIEGIATLIIVESTIINATEILMKMSPAQRVFSELTMLRPFVELSG